MRENRLFALLGMALAKNLEQENEKDVKIITESEKTYPRNIISTTTKSEGQEYQLSCEIKSRAGAIYVYWSTEPTSDGYLAKRKVFEHWGTDTQFNQWKGRTKRVNAANMNTMTIVISKLGLEDDGYYFCEYLIPGTEGNVFSDLHQLTMWARPEPPQITGKPDYYANTVTHIQQEKVDFTKEQSILQCRAEKGFPKPKLKWIDQNGATLAMSDDNTDCFANEIREELWDCSLSLSAIITPSMDQRHFTCEMTHETLNGQAETAQQKINVHYPPIMTVEDIKGNRTTKEVTCSGRGNPAPSFEIQIGNNGQPVPITNPKGKYYVSDLESLNENDLIFCYAKNGLQPHGEMHDSIENIFTAGPMLGMMQWAIIAAAGGAVLIVVIILVACCCCKKEKDSFNNKDKKRGYQPGQNGSMNMSKSAYGQTMASNVSYNFRQPDGREDPKSQVEDYLRRAQSKEQLMADYDHASSHPSEVYQDQLQRTREMISRSRENLDYIEEQSAIEVTNRDLRAPQRQDSFEDSYEPDPPAYNNQYNQYVPSHPPSSRGYGYNDEHLYQNDPMTQHQSSLRVVRRDNSRDSSRLDRNQHRFSYHNDLRRDFRPQSSYLNHGYYQQKRMSYQDDGPPPPPRNQSVRLV